MAHINLSKRERYIFIVSAALVSAALLYNFALEPNIKKWRLINTEITVKKARMDKGIRLLKRRDSIIEEYNKYAKTTKNISKILGYMENLADSLGVKTGNIKPGQAVDKGLYKEYIIELQIEGQMQHIVKFLSGLVKLPTLVVLKKFDFRVVSQNPLIFKGTVTLQKIII